MAPANLVLVEWSKPLAFRSPDLGDRPLHLLRPIREPAQHHLLAALRLCSAKIDALLQRHAGALRAQPPAAAAGRQAQQYALAILLHIGGDGRVQIQDGEEVSGQTYALPGTGDTFDRVNVLNAIKAVQQLFTGTVSNADTDDTTATANTAATA